MKTGNCKYENGTVNSCFDCPCDECQQSVAEYAAYLNDIAKEEEFKSIMESQGGCRGI